MDKKTFFSTSGGLVVGICIGFLASPLSPSKNASTVSPVTPEPPKKVLEKIVYKECPQDSADTPLPAPSLSANLATPLMSNHEGEIRVTWNEVPHATRYRLQVLDTEGNVIKTYTTSRSTVYLKELPYDEGRPFTPYSVVLSTINRKSEEGALSPRYEVRVLPLKNLTAPTINEISIEN
ncbi:hypothetical protein [Bdellovibrio sp. HCB-110]|uniref:hypothetical protein n=1 Tax=Bdellovibrio sp. HCB-110 TaxID=3391182 RepID=UPI0039B60052